VLPDGGDSHLHTFTGEERTSHNYFVIAPVFTIISKKNLVGIKVMENSGGLTENGGVKIRNGLGDFKRSSQGVFSKSKRVARRSPENRKGLGAGQTVLRKKRRLRRSSV